MSRTFNKVELADILNYDNIAADWGIIGELDGETVTLISSPDCGHILIDRYGDRSIYIPDNTPLDDYAYLLKLWRIWLDLNKTDYLRAYAALQLKYDPIANYDSHEEETVQHGHVLTDQYTPGVKTTSTSEYSPGVTDTTTSQIYGYNSAAASDADKVTNSKSGKDTTTNTTEREGNDTNTHTNSGSDITTRDKSGNIGTTKTQEMLLDEMRLRLRDYVDRVIKVFIDDYTAY